jgi:hypothetical protein
MMSFIFSHTRYNNGRTSAFNQVSQCVYLLRYSLSMLLSVNTDLLFSDRPPKKISNENTNAQKENEKWSLFIL